MLWSLGLKRRIQPTHIVCSTQDLSRGSSHALSMAVAMSKHQGFTKYHKSTLFKRSGFSESSRANLCYCPQVYRNYPFNLYALYLYTMKPNINLNIVINTL